ncbi:hypothetical protein PHLGIDRAFT_338137 [Phlebiopsis gigantea 11061_1 CR5-6]|uniref:Uncharacterized protein n=1 Tax=Phlebiopsis gigantea (strain 11061_1 CR5-6) TaxID=745531 RepID=A0A0C3SAI9_PHLG1|nr:hypothetical protein PHLGIDRAFT_338137 [Phlebiopsis gigantea 11061_1 CR5-6]
MFPQRRCRHQYPSGFHTYPVHPRIVWRNPVARICPACQPTPLPYLPSHPCRNRQRNPAPHWSFQQQFIPPVRVSFP